MKSIEKEKMCVSCEGRIPLDTEVCPFCATHQRATSVQNSFQAPIFQNQSLEDSLTSLYTPPYQGKRPQFDTQSLKEPEMPLYKEVTERPEMDRPLIDSSGEDEEVPRKGSFLPTILLTAGAQFAVIGLMQLFFSKNGVLRLEWDANYWFFYFLASAPLFYFGFQKMKGLRD